MLFDKFQYHEEDIVKRGYSQSCTAKNEDGTLYWIKWLLGIGKNDVKAKLLADNLRHLQRARHLAFPEIIEYGYDKECSAYAIVNNFLSDVNTLENCISKLELRTVISGLIEIAECLQELHLKHKITHGDITPANILVGEDGRFFIVDFGLSEITNTLSQERDLEIFARAFAAPEKLTSMASKGFAFQSDIYSFGRIIEWSFNALEVECLAADAVQLKNILSDTPANRPSWQQVISFLREIELPVDKEVVQVAFRLANGSEILTHLNSTTPIFNISANAGDNIKMDIIIGTFICEGVLWINSEDKLLFNELKLQTSIAPGIIDRKHRDGKKLPLSYFYSIAFSFNKVNLTPYFQKWYDAKYKQSSLRENRKAVKEQLSFYKELLKKEIEFIEKRSLRLCYSDYEINGDVIEFHITPDDKYSSTGALIAHIEVGNAIDSEGFSYKTSTSSTRNQKKDETEFSGKPFEFDINENIFKIKDCEKLAINNFPRKGYLFENISNKTEEKQRQLQAISKVENNDVQNPDLIYYLFKPEALPAIGIDNFETLENVKQKDISSGKPFVYTYSQTKAIRNALDKGPVTVIQGPPGTGKTTVITEIVFQLLALKPEAKILITSQTNNAVDQVLENLLKNKIPILRLNGYTAPKIPAIKQHTLEKKLEGWKLQVKSNAERNFARIKSKFLNVIESKGLYHKNIVNALLNESDWKKARERIVNMVRPVTSMKKLVQLPDNKEKAIILISDVLGINLQEYIFKLNLHRDWLAAVNALDEKSAINQKLIDSIRVIGATCNHIAAKKYSRYNFEFDYVIMDESGKATVAEALVPITMGNNLVYVGDHRQLRPMLTSDNEVEKWLRDKFKSETEEFESWDEYFNRPSLFEQVIYEIDDNYKAQLTDNRRSSADQVGLTSKYFYEACGDEEITYVERNRDEEHCLPLSLESSVLFIDIGNYNRNEKDEKNSSFNPISADAIFAILECLNNYSLVKKYSVGVITGYTAQKKLLDKIRNRCLQNGFSNLLKWDKSEDKFSVSVFDRFQGLERDIMIVDLVKSGIGLDLGFLEVPNRINVALSRQKRLLIIVGDYTGIVNARTRRLNGEKAALQKYLAALDENWIVKLTDLKKVFP